MEWHMDFLEPFTPGFDYRTAYPVITPGEEIVNVKMEALELIVNEYDVTHQRVAPFIQLISMVRVELPRMFVDVVGWDDESSYCMSQHLLDMATTQLQGWPVSLLHPHSTRLGMDRNHVPFIFSTPALNLLCNMLTNPLDHIVEIINDGVMDQITQIETVQAAYRDIFIDGCREFTYPVYANTGTKELVGSVVSELIRAADSKE
jgi:hypothetical protein